MSKLFKIEVTLYIKAFDKKTAEACAEMNVFTASEALRQVGSFSGAPIQDKFLVSGEATEVTEIPKQHYDKEKIIKQFGEKRGARWLQSMVEGMYQ